MLGLIAFFISLAVLAFFVATTSFLGLSFGTLGHFLPFFLLLVDLHKASLVAIKATSSESREELRENLGQAMEQVGKMLHCLYFCLSNFTLVVVIVFYTITRACSHPFPIPFLPGPSVLLDTMVEILVFSAISLSSHGLGSVKSISCFGTVSAIANFIVSLRDFFW